MKKMKGKNVGRRSLSLLLALVMIIAMLPAWSAKAAESTDNAASETASETTGDTTGTTTTTKDDEKPIGYVEPKFEEGKINLNGYYTVAKDGQITANLEWTYPYENPQRDGPDPAKPYNYKMWQSELSEDGTTWSDWETRSPVDVDAGDHSVKVLNVAPNSASLSYLKDWMNREVDDYDGSKTTVGRNLITVDSVLIDDYNSNPDAYLKDSDGKYKYSVIMFGSYDSNDFKDLSETSEKATEAFAEAGGGLMFGHDTLTGNCGDTPHTYFNMFADEKYLNLEMYYGQVIYKNTHVKVVDTGYLTSRPWDLEGRTLTIPETHVIGQKVPDTTKTRVWMQMSDENGNVDGGQTVPNDSNATDNYYLVTRSAYAMIQTGHSKGAATDDEAKVLANTLIYIAQSTTKTSAKDSSFIDKAAPKKPDGEVTEITPSVDDSGKVASYTAKISLSGSTDSGTKYAYRIQAVKTGTISESQEVDYKDEIWSSTATDPNDDSIYKSEALSGLKGYYVNTINTNGQAETLTSLPSDAQILEASDAETAVTYETKSLTPGIAYYVHAYAVDYAGNVSDDLLIKLSVKDKTVTFDDKTGSGEIYKTLLTDEGLLASMPEDPTRDGYEFLGWYHLDADGEESEVTEKTVFSLDNDNPAGEQIYAKWGKTWDVNIGQRGGGTVTLSDPDGSNGEYREGSDVKISCEPDDGYVLKAIWLDGVMMEPDESGTLTIPDISAGHYVLVEFEEEGKESSKYYSVSTQLTGGGSKSSITPTVRMEEDDARTSNYVVSWTVPDGYEVQSVMVDGMNRTDLVNKTSVTFNKIKSDHKVAVTMVKEGTASDTAMITTKLTGGPGSVTPSTDITKGGNAVLQASVDDPKNYELSSITICDKDGNTVATINKGESSSSSIATVDWTTGKITLSNVDEDYQVVVQASPKSQAGTVAVPASDQLRVDISKTGHGTVSDSKIVQRGENYNVTWKADDGWRVQDITIDGKKTYFNTGSNTSDNSESGTSEGVNYSTLANPVEDDSTGEQPFKDIQANHSVKVTFVKASSSGSTANDTDDSSGSGGSNSSDGTNGTDGSGNSDSTGSTYRVETSLTGDAAVQVSAGNTAVDAGDPYTIEWSVEEGNVITQIYVNGESREDLLDKGKLEIENVDKNYKIEVVAEKIGDPQPSVEETVVNENRTGENRAGDVLTYTVTAENKYPYNTWTNVVLQELIPSGMRLDTSSIILKKNGVEIGKPDASCYDEKTGLLSVPIGDVNGEDTYTLSFQTVITQDAITPDDSSARELKSIAMGVGDNGVGSSEEVKPNGEDYAKPKTNPDGSITMTAKNLSNDTGSVEVGDQIQYTVKAENRRYNTVWTGVRIVDQIPEGLQIDTDSIYLKDANGVMKKLSPDVYDEDSRTLAVFVGDIYGEESYELTFITTVEESALGKDIGNVAEAYGGTASDDGQPGHWGSEQAYEIEVGAPGFTSVVEENEKLSQKTGKVYAGSEKVTKQSKSSKNEKSGSNSNSKAGSGVKTGDGTPIMAYAILLILAGCIILLELWKKKRKQ